MAKKVFQKIRQEKICWMIEEQVEVEMKSHWRKLLNNRTM